jgi:hypothetical protein
MDGEMEGMACFYFDSDSAGEQRAFSPAGEQEFLIITMLAKEDICGTSTITLSGALIVDCDYQDYAPDVQVSTITITSLNTGQIPPLQRTATGPSNTSNESGTIISPVTASPEPRAMLSHAAIPIPRQKPS